MAALPLLHLSCNRLRTPLWHASSSHDAIQWWRSPCGGDAASGSCGAEGMAAAAPPEGWERRAGMAAALDGASDSCPELALPELAAEAFLLHRSPHTKIREGM